MSEPGGLTSVRGSPLAFALLTIAACGGRESGLLGGSSAGTSGAIQTSGGLSATGSTGSLGVTSGAVGTGAASGGSSGAASGGVTSGSLVSASGTFVSGSPVGTSGAVASGSGSASGIVASSGTGGVTSGGDGGSDSGPVAKAPVPSAGCGKAWTGALGQWVSQPTGCTAGTNNQGTSACQAIPPGSTVPATATKGSPEYRGWWVFVPKTYDPSKPYRVIYERNGCGVTNYFNAGEEVYPYQSFDDGQAIQVGLDFDTYSELPDCPDGRDPQSNDLAFLPWLMNEIEGTFCVDTSSEWMSEYADDASLAQQFDCAFPAKLRGQVIVTGFEPGAAASGYPGSLPACNPAPTAALYVHDLNDTDNPLAGILPGCSRVLKQNGCGNTQCDPLDKTLTRAYAVPASVNFNKAGAGATCVSFNGCPAEYPVVFCLTTNQGHSDGQSWGVLPLFWDFMNQLSCAPGQTEPNGFCGPCPIGEAACAGTCIDEQTDPSFCGACNNSCPGSAPFCRSGVCSAN